MEEGVSRVRTNLAERLGYEPPEIPEGESLEERRERIRAIYQWRKAMRRLARLGHLAVGRGLRAVHHRRLRPRDGDRRRPRRRVADDVFDGDLAVTEQKIPVSFRPDQLADVIEAMLRDVMDRLPSERMNDEGERLSPVQGGYGLLVDWLDSVSGKDWLGDLKVSLVHPYGIVPQAGMTQVADMDFFFLKTPQTKR